VKSAGSVCLFVEVWRELTVALECGRKKLCSTGIKTYGIFYSMNNVETYEEIYHLEQNLFPTKKLKTKRTEKIQWKKSYTKKYKLSFMKYFQ